VAFDTEAGDENNYLQSDPGMYTRVQAVSVVFALSPAVAKMTGANLFKFRVNNAKFWQDGGRVSIVNSFIDKEMCVDSSCDLSNCKLTMAYPWCDVRVLLEPDDYILQLFGLQNSYTEAGEEAHVDIEWMPPTGCEYIKCADTGENCERVTGSDMPWFPIAPGAMPLMECEHSVLAEVVAVTSFSKPFCFQPSSYLGAVGDCWLPNAAAIIDAAAAAATSSSSSGGRCFGEWDINGATLNNVYSAREASTSSLAAAAADPQVSIDADTGKCSRAGQLGDDSLTHGRVFTLPFEDGDCTDADCRVEQQTPSPAFTEYARIVTFRVDQNTYAVSNVDVAPKYPDIVGFVPKPDGSSGHTAHRGSYSYDFTRVCPGDPWGSTAVHLPGVPMAADAVDPGTVSMWVKKQTSFVGREALFVFHHADVEANVGQTHSGGALVNWALSHIELGMGLNEAADDGDGDVARLFMRVTDGFGTVVCDVWSAPLALLTDGSWHNVAFVMESDPRSRPKGGAVHVHPGWFTEADISACILRRHHQAFALAPVARTRVFDRAWFQRLRLKFDELLSRFAFDFKLRRYTKAWPPCTFTWTPTTVRRCKLKPVEIS
jgi:hypothetical protein